MIKLGCETMIKYRELGRWVKSNVPPSSDHFQKCPHLPVFLQNPPWLLSGRSKRHQRAWTSDLASGMRAAGLHRIPEG